MTIAAIIEDLSSFGVDIELGIKVISKSKPTPESDELLQKITERREEVIDHLLIGKFVQLPANTPLPKEFLSPRMKEISHVFRTCYDMLKLHEGAKTEEEFKKAASYHEGRLDPADPLAIDMNTVAYKELSRQYYKSKGVEK